MAKRKHQKEEDNYDRWMVSYADFVTLLFAFFVVMYSVSSINEGKYRVLTESLDTAFSRPTGKNKSASANKFSKIGLNLSRIPDRYVVPIGLSNLPPPRFSEEDHTKTHDNSRISSRHLMSLSRRNIKKVTHQLTEAIKPLLNQGLVNVKPSSRWIEIEINSSILFKSGSAKLSRQSVPVLEKIAYILSKTNTSIHVEGFTDNVPINSYAFPSNWELSAARAASVVHLFSKAGISANRMAAIGYGQFHPIASNETAEGRMKNRRVILIVNSSPNPRYARISSSRSKRASQIDISNKLFKSIKATIQPKQENTK